MTWDRQNCEECLLDDGCRVDGVACGYIRTLRAKIEDVTTYIKKEIEFHAPDMTEGSWLNEHLEVILKILEVQSSASTMNLEETQ